MKPLVLVLDDQVRYTQSLQRALARSYDVLTAATVAEAQAEMSDRVALVVSDVRLDETTPTDRQGLDFVRWLHSAYPATPVVVISALDDPSLESEALAVGGASFLRKPVSVSALLATIAEAIARPTSAGVPAS